MLWSAGWLIHGPVSNVACEQSVTRNQFALNLYEGRRVERSLNIRDKLAAAWASKAQRAEPRTSPCVGAPSGRRGDCFCLPTCQFGGRKAAWSNEPGLRACPIHLLELFYSDDIVCFSLGWEDLPRFERFGIVAVAGVKRAFGTPSTDRARPETLDIGQRSSIHRPLSSFHPRCPTMRVLTQNSKFSLRKRSL